MRDPYMALASAIIENALNDLKNRNPNSKNSYAYHNANKFFNTKWFEYLAESVDIHPDNIRRTIHEIKREKANEWINSLPDPYQSTIIAMIESCQTDKTDYGIQLFENGKETLHTIAQNCTVT